jgi:hypothetical protein
MVLVLVLVAGGRRCGCRCDGGQALVVVRHACNPVCLINTVYIVYTVSLFI